MRYWAGIDLGSVSLKLVVVNDEGALETSVYMRTRGRTLASLRDVFFRKALRFGEFAGVVVTGSGRKLLSGVPGAHLQNEILAQARAAAHLTPDVRTIIEIGGQDSKLILLEKDPQSGIARLQDHALNDVCAAGTGSFIDQQAARLGLDTRELGEQAARMSNPAFVAGRCSVFAKSDMMHLQQQGVPRSQILEGLCLALVRNFIATVGRGRSFRPPVNFQGGVAANPAVVRAFERELDLSEGSIRIPPYFKVTGAYGAALSAMEFPFESGFAVTDIMSAIDWRLNEKNSGHIGAQGAARRLGALPPGPGISRGEPGLPAPEPGAAPLDAFLGVDVGSASAKMVLVDPGGEILAQWYRPSEGDMVGAVRRGMEEFGSHIGGVRIRGAGVTGSGRHFIGALLGADAVINEISSQARAALRIDPEIDTLIEIGGQDSKYVRFDRGVVTDFEMNKACAAGTGSFLQEQSARLGFDVERDFERLARNAQHPCDLGTRCTVFMESDLIHYQQNGARREDLVAGLAYGIAHNYLEKVVGQRRVGSRIHLQGGVAANGAVVSAFSRLLGRPVTVSPYHRVTGAYGAALYAMERMQANRSETAFTGFSADESRFAVERFACGGCPNVCSISQMTMENGERVFIGGICGKYDEKEKQLRYEATPDLFDERKRIFEACLSEEPPAPEVCPVVVGVPRSLFYFYSLPLWWSFFHALGIRVEISAPTHPGHYSRGIREARSETCLPVKLCYGHVEELIARGVETVFIPAEIEQPQKTGDPPRSLNCPYIQGVPYMMRAAFKGRARILTAAVYRGGDRENTASAMRAAAEALGTPRYRVEEAIKAGLRSQARFVRGLTRAGRRAMDFVTPRNSVVMLGKPHHLFDDGQNMHVGKKLRKLGVTAIPYDYLPLREAAVPEGWNNIVWKNSQDLIRAAIIAVRRGLPTIKLGNFGCGPDSFVTTYLEEILRGHPHLVLEVDDHTADAGIMTRLEAFLDTAFSRPPARPVDIPEGRVIMRREKGAASMGPSEELKTALFRRTLYIPHVCTGLNEIFAAAISASGIRVENLPRQNERVEELGRKYAVGNECHPYIITLGDISRLAGKDGFDPDRAAFLMFNYDGACRLSQFAFGHKLALERMGLGSAVVVGPITGTRTEELTRLFGLNTTRSLWKGLLAAELLQRRLYATRPYEVQPGSADAAYAGGIRRIVRVIAEPSFRGYFFDKPFIEALQKALAQIAAVPVRRTYDRPKIGVLGEFFTVLNEFANQDLLRKLEALGAEVSPQGFAITNVMMYYYEKYYARERLRNGSRLPALYYDGLRRWLVRWAGIVEREGAWGAGESRLLRANEIERAAFGRIHSDIDPISSTFVARFNDFVEQGVDGICCPTVLNCMLSNMIHPVFRRIAAENNGVPLLIASYDGLGQTNMDTRLEAFVEQARSRRGGGGVFPAGTAGHYRHP